MNREYYKHERKYKESEKRKVTSGNQTAKRKQVQNRRTRLQVCMHTAAAITHSTAQTNIWLLGFNGLQFGHSELELQVSVETAAAVEVAEVEVATAACIRKLCGLVYMYVLRNVSACRTACANLHRRSAANIYTCLLALLRTIWVRSRVCVLFLIVTFQVRLILFRLFSFLKILLCCRFLLLASFAELSLLIVYSTFSEFFK